MKMSVATLKKILEQRLASDNRKITFNRDKDELRVEDTTIKKGINISLPPIVGKWEKERDQSIDEVVYYVEEALKAMTLSIELTGHEKNIFPVIRSTSFPKKTDTGGEMLMDEHTAETRIYYALDLGNTYRLIDEHMLAKENWKPNMIREMAKFNLRSLANPLKKDSVRGNDFYFLNTNDGYDASRILNENLLKEMEEKVEGKLAISIPHQDVLIFADIKNDIGYDILAQMTMSFFTNGAIPITALSFYYEDGKLEPIFIMAKNRPIRKE